MANNIEIVSGNNQSQKLSTQLSAAFICLVKDPNVPLSGQTVTFAIASVPAGATGQALTVASGVTDSNGNTMVFLTLGNKAGTYTVTFTLAGATGSPLTFSATATATAAQANQVIAALDAKSVLGILATDATYDDMLTGWCNRVSDIIEQFCNRWFVQRDVTNEVHDGNGLQQLSLFRTPVVGFPSSATDEAGKLACSQYQTDPTQVWVNHESDSRYIQFDALYPYYMRLFRQLFWKGWQNVRVSYRAGYASVPSGVQETALKMVQMQFNEFKVGNDWLGKASISMNTQVGTLTTSVRLMRPEWIAALSPYKRLNV